MEYKFVVKPKIIEAEEFIGNFSEFYQKIVKFNSIFIVDYKKFNQERLLKIKERYSSKKLKLNSLEMQKYLFNHANISESFYVDTFSRVRSVPLNLGFVGPHKDSDEGLPDDCVNIWFTFKNLEKTESLQFLSDEYFLPSSAGHFKLGQFLTKKNRLKYNDSLIQRYGYKLEAYQAIAFNSSKLLHASPSIKKSRKYRLTCDMRIVSKEDFEKNIYFTSSYNFYTIKYLNSIDWNEGKISRLSASRKKQYKTLISNCSLEKALNSNSADNTFKSILENSSSQLSIKQIRKITKKLPFNVRVRNNYLGFCLNNRNLTKTQKREILEITIKNIIPEDPSKILPNIILFSQSMSFKDHLRNADLIKSFNIYISPKYNWLHLWILCYLYKAAFNTINKILHIRILTKIDHYLFKFLYYELGMIMFRDPYCKSTILGDSGKVIFLKD